MRMKFKFKANDHCAKDCTGVVKVIMKYKTFYKLRYFYCRFSKNLSKFVLSEFHGTIHKYFAKS